MSKQRILCYGDSNTYGYDPRSYLGSRYPEEIRWTGLLRSEGHEVINAGQNGRVILTARDLADVTGRIIGNLPLDRITILLGTNDILQRHTADQAGEDMEQLLGHIRGTAPDLPILLIAPPVIENGFWVQDAAMIEESLRLSGIYSEIAERYQIEYADAGQWGIELAFDGVHFSEKGHAEFARRLSALLENTGSMGEAETNSDMIR